MAETSVLRAGAAPAPQKLDELMLAMDVVDTLRHQEGLAEKELALDDRDVALKARLRALYEGQGLVVSDRILDEGIRALKESRFTYTPPPPSFAVTLAKLWVHRGRVGKVLAVVLVLAGAGIGWSLWQGAATRQAAEAIRIELAETLPAALDVALTTTLSEAKVAAARSRAERLGADGAAALARGDAAGVRAAISGLDGLRQTLATSYVLRIVSRPGEQTGFDRIPEVNEAARNYYLVVEPVTPDGAVLAVPVTSEEDGKTSTVTRWGVRVPKRTFDAVRRDKSDDGIVQDNILGEKPRGALDVVYAMTVDGGAVTSW